MLTNKLGITNQVELAKVEEKISKTKAKALYDTGDINQLEIGTYKGLADIHRYLFDDIYDFAGKLRTVNIVGETKVKNTFVLSLKTEQTVVQKQLLRK